MFSCGGNIRGKIMGNYNLHGLDPRTFQQMVQALAIAEIGSGVIVYGDGPDGGRDASFRGKVNYPSEADPWDGYIDIQAKFCVKPKLHPQKDGDWVCKQIRADLDKFVQEDSESSPSDDASPKSTRRKLEVPEYYLLVTSIDLTPFPEAGTDARVRALLKDYAETLGFKDYDVWGGGKIQRLLDKHRDIAIAYAAFITVGDVLEKMHEYLDNLSPDFEDVMSDYLQAELASAEHYACLKEAGSDTQEHPRLAQVFIDLRVDEEPASDPPDDETELSDGEAEDTDELPDGFVADVLRVGALRLDRKSIEERDRVYSDIGLLDLSQSGRFVVIGGPGQGKSTLCQYVCQLYRAAILNDRPNELICPEAQEALDAILKRCEVDGVLLPTARRFPIRIELREFADSLAKEECDSLLDYVAKIINKCSVKSIVQDHLHTWLKNYPWLIVLDGLDEVPATGNRDDVMESLRHFSGHCATRGADVLTLATSRPQGYGDAFKSSIYFHRYLMPLSTKRALHYADLLVEACHPNCDDTRKNILERLKRAAARPTSERLMRSPLQVTILAVLAELSGELPDARWQLFKDYYQTIYRRETQRRLNHSSALSEYENEITQLHQNVGLKLHTINEKAGESGATLAIEAFKEMVTSSLAARFDGEEKENLQRVAKQINDAALERLVFLVSPLGDNIGFEIRSFQEFMAARALTDGSDKDTLNRLAAIAPFPFWRNVFLFAAGRCVRDRKHLLEDIIQICKTLNTDKNTPGMSTTLVGSRLALDMLEDGTFRTQPKYLRALTDYALKLLNVPNSFTHHRLARFLCSEERVQDRYQSVLLKSIEAPETNIIRSGTWAVLLLLIQSGNKWAQEVAEQHWPPDIKHQYRILSNLRQEKTTHPWIDHKIILAASRMKPTDRQVVELAGKVSTRPDWLAALYSRFESYIERIPIRFTNEEDSAFELQFYSLNDERKNIVVNFSSVPNSNEAWKPLESASLFRKNPSPETLGAVLYCIAENSLDESEFSLLAQKMPWPIAACLSAANNSRELKELGDKALSGNLGTSDEWLANENLWRTNGISPDDITVAIHEPSFSLRSGWKSFPMTYLYDRFSDSSLCGMIDIYQSSGDSPVRTALAKWIGAGLFYCLACQRAVLDDCPEPQHVKEWILASQFGDVVADTLSAIPAPSPLPKEWIVLLNDLGSTPLSIAFHMSPFTKLFVRDVCHAYSADPTQSGLLAWLSVFASYGHTLHLQQEVLDWTEESDSVAFLRKAKLVLVQGHTTPEKAKRIGTLVAAALSEDNIEEGIVDREFEEVFLRHHGRKEVVIHFADQVLQKHSSERLTDALGEWLATRKSPLHDPERIKELGLTFIL
jgi:hypothetical protein